MRKLWKQKEKDDARDFGGRTQIGSGVHWKNKQDVKTKELLIEDKTTAKDSYSIKKDKWLTIRKHAILESRIPVLSIRFLSTNDTDLIVIDKQDFLELLNN